jgi:hypothetical protein
MKVSRGFWTVLVFTAGLLVACNRTPEQPAGSTATQTNEPATEAAPANAEQPTTSATPSAPPAAGPAVMPPKSTAPASTKNSASTAPPASKGVSGANAANATPPEPAVRQEVLQILTGTTLTVVMIDPVATDTSKPGDTFTASIGEPVIVNGKTALAKGTKVRGRVETVEEPGRVKGKAALSLVLTQVIGKDKTYNISTEPFSAEAESGTKKDALKVGGAAAIGAAIGAITGGGKGAAIGAGVGGGAGTAAVLATKGSQLRIEPETKVNFILKKNLDVVTIKSTS